VLPYDGSNYVRRLLRVPADAPWSEADLDAFLFREGAVAEPLDTENDLENESGTATTTRAPFGIPNGDYHNLHFLTARGVTERFRYYGFAVSQANKLSSNSAQWGTYSADAGDSHLALATAGRLQVTNYTGDNAHGKTIFTVCKRVYIGERENPEADDPEAEGERIAELMKLQENWSNCFHFVKITSHTVRPELHPDQTTYLGFGGMWEHGVVENTGYVCMPTTWNFMSEQMLQEAAGLPYPLALRAAVQADYPSHEAMHFAASTLNRTQTFLESKPQEFNQSVYV